MLTQYEIPELKKLMYSYVCAAPRLSENFIKRRTGKCVFFWISNPGKNRYFVANCLFFNYKSDKLKTDFI